MTNDEHFAARVQVDTAAIDREEVAEPVAAPVWFFIRVFGAILIGVLSTLFLLFLVLDRVRYSLDPILEWSNEGLSAVRDVMSWGGRSEDIWLGDCDEE